MSNVTDDMLNNSFLNNTAINNNVDGIWTGAIGAGLSTYIIKPDGNGISCYYHRGDAIVYKQKIYEFKDNAYSMIAEDGTIGTLIKENGYLLFKSYGFNYKLRNDAQLDLANTAC